MQGRHADTFGNIVCPGNVRNFTNAKVNKLQKLTTNYVTLLKITVFAQINARLASVCQIWWSVSTDATVMARAGIGVKGTRPFVFVNDMAADRSSRMDSRVTYCLHSVKCCNTEGMTLLPS